MTSNIPYARQLIDQEDIKDITKVLKSNFLTQGPKIKEFENKLTKYTSSKYAISLNSASSALQLSYLALVLKKK